MTTSRELGPTGLGLSVERLAALLREADNDIDMTDPTSWATQLAKALLPRLREDTPREPCDDVHRVVNGRCENCGAVFPDESAP